MQFLKSVLGLDLEKAQAKWRKLTLRMDRVPVLRRRLELRQGEVVVQATVQGQTR